MKYFPNDEAYKSYLPDLKWHDGFVCPKCGHTKGCLKKGYKYHCYGCGKVELPMAGILFHKIKFELRKAFRIVFEMSTSTQSLSSIQMGERYDIFYEYSYQLNRSQSKQIIFHNNITRMINVKPWYQSQIINGI